METSESGMLATSKNEKTTKTYFFKEAFSNEYSAFVKYYYAIRENGYIQKIFKDLENMGDCCDLYKLPNKLDFDSLNSYFEPLSPVKSNKEVLCASRLLKLETTPQKGRHLVARKAIPRNKILINEQPSVIQVNPVCSCVGDSKSIYRCHNCGVGMKQFYICDGCNVCIFCSRACLIKANKEFHIYECYGFQRHFWSLDDTDYSYLSLRIMLYGASWNFRFKGGDSTVYGNKDNNYPFINKLKTNFVEMSFEHINKILYSSARNLVYLITKTSFFHPFKNRSDLQELHLYIGGLMVKHYCQAQMNNIILKYPNYNLDFGTVSGSAKAICPTISLLNHSCAPNAVVIVYTDYIVVKSMRHIKSGEEITICYSEIDALLPYTERNLITREILFFTCDCKNCLFEKKTGEAPFKCPSCNTGYATYLEEKNGEHVGYCFDCDCTLNLNYLSEHFKTVDVCKNAYKKSKSMTPIFKIAEIYGAIFPNTSPYLLEIYRLLYDHYYSLGDQPLEVLKYGILLFNIAEQVVSRLYLRLLISKVKFIMYFTETKYFSKIRSVSEEELQTMEIFVHEVIKTKGDLEFYLPQEKMCFYKDVQLKISQWFSNMRVVNKKK
nr:uncharacterized protein LOC111508952 isoform X1 [Leptinotarsa decemlineata]